MKTIIFSLGFDISGIVSTLTNISLEPEDKLIFLIPSRDTDRSLQARKEIESFLNLLAVRGLKLNYTYLKVNEEDIQEMLKVIIEVILNNKGEIYIEAIGGLRSIVVAMTIAAILLRNKIVSFHTIAESSGKRISVPLIEPTVLNLDHIDLEILKLAAFLKGKITAPYAEIELRLSKPTITRRLRRLAKKGLLISTVKKPATYELTPLGWLAIRLGKNNAYSCDKS